MRQGRIFVALCILAGAWIAVYWLWDAPGVSSSGARVTFASQPGDSVEVRMENGARPDSRRSGAVIETIDTTPTTGVIAPEFETYVVKADGETWADISKALYATPEHAAAIADANPFVVKLTEGREIRYPVDPGNVRGIPLDGADAAVNSAQPAAAGPEIIATHTVADGETLGDISKTYYGSWKHWEVIYNFNKAALGIDSEREIRAGHVLKITPLPD